MGATGYIGMLREHLGHRPIIMTAAGVIVVNERKEILLQKRTDNHLWGITGGALELGENFEEAAKRELREETSLIAKELSLINVYAGKEMYNKYPNKDEIFVAVAVFLCKGYEGEMIEDDDESEELCFFSLDNLPDWKEVNAPDITILKDLCKKYKKIVLE